MHERRSPHTDARARPQQDREISVNSAEKQPWIAEKAWWAIFHHRLIDYVVFMVIGNCLGAAAKYLFHWLDIHMTVHGWAVF